MRGTNDGPGRSAWAWPTGRRGHNGALVLSTV